MNGGAVRPFHQAVVVIVVAARQSVKLLPPPVNAFLSGLRQPLYRTAGASSPASLLKNLPAYLAHRIFQAKRFLHRFVHEQNPVRVDIGHVQIRLHTAHHGIVYPVLQHIVFIQVLIGKCHRDNGQQEPEYGQFPVRPVALPGFFSKYRKSHKPYIIADRQNRQTTFRHRKRCERL